MHFGIGAPEKWAPTLESPPLLNIRFSFASVHLSSCLISPSLIHLLPILINYIRRKFQATVSGSFWGKKINLKSWFQAKNFWPAAMSSEESKESLTCDEVTSWRSWRSEALLSWTGLKSCRKQARTGCSCVWFHSQDCIFPLHDEHLLYPSWLPYFFGLKRQTEMDLQTRPVRRRSVCTPFLQTKQPCSPHRTKFQESVNGNVAETCETVPETRRITCVSVSGFVTFTRVSVAATFQKYGNMRFHPVPSKSLRWLGKHLSSIKVVAL